MGPLTKRHYECQKTEMSHNTYNPYFTMTTSTLRELQTLPQFHLYPLLPLRENDIDYFIILSIHSLKLGKPNLPQCHL